MNERSTNRFWGYGFIAPNFVGFLVFTLLPVLAAVVLSFCAWDILTPPKFVGFQNFIELLGFHREEGQLLANDPFFWKYLYNTLFMMMGIPFSIIGALLLAVLMTQKIKGRIVFRTIYFLPTISSGVAVCFLWKWLYSTDMGLINLIIAEIGGWLHLDLRGPAWLTSPGWAKPALIFMGLWTAVGGTNMILYMAALTGVPRDLYEAAEIDGAGAWHKFWKITWPMVSPTTFFIFIMAVIAGFQGGFMQAYTMTKGGPAGATTTLEYYIYTQAYESFNMGYASAVAMVLFSIIIVISLVNWKYGGRRVHY